MDKKKALLVSTLVGISSVATNALAFNTGDVLGFDAGVTECLIGGTFPNCQYGLSGVNAGSYFAMDFNGDGNFGIDERTAIAPGPSGGIIIGVPQPATGSHMGCPDGTENPGPDMPWCFFGNTGMHQTATVPVTDNGNGTLSFIGWGVTWNGIPNIPMGGDPVNFPVDTGNAIIICSHNPCQVGDTYTLDYTAHVPLGDPSGFGGVHYQLHLEKDSGIPQLTISLSVAGGSIQECSVTGGSNVTISVDTTIPPGDTLDSIIWSVDGSAVTGGNSINEFLSLGSHTIDATLTTTNGLIASDSVDVLVQDTTKPVLSLGFRDSLTGELITSILHSRVHFVAIDLLVNDVCDAEPVSQGALMPLMEVVHADVIKIFGNTGEVEMPITAIQLTGTASDASGNNVSGQAVLSVKAD